jgi:hypothetical protein
MSNGLLFHMHSDLGRSGTHKTLVLMLVMHTMCDMSIKIITSSPHMLCLKLSLLFIKLTPPLAVTIGLLDSLGNIFFSSWMVDGLLVDDFLDYYLDLYSSDQSRHLRSLHSGINMLLMYNNIRVDIGARDQTSRYALNLLVRSVVHSM